MILKSSELYLSGIFILFAIIYLNNHSELGSKWLRFYPTCHPPFLMLANYLIYLFKASTPHYDTKYSLPDFCRMGLLYLQIPN